MDLEMENRIAAILLKEAAELRRQAEQEGALAYLRKPNVRVRPNSRFLTSTVLGVQQANRNVEVNEMWRLRQKELELDNRFKHRSRYGSSRHDVDSDSSRSRSHRHDASSERYGLPCSSSRNVDGDCRRPDDEGLGDDEVEEFLRSRVKRGRGSVGSRIDETGPYLSESSHTHDAQLLSSDHVREKRQSHIVLGPQRPSWKSKEFSSDGESEDDHGRRKKSKMTSSGISRKHYSKKHESKEKTRDKKKKSRHEKRHKH